jgi:N6-L-threonylcarbamoyladenine synthase
VIDVIIEEAMQSANVHFNDIATIAATVGPGLIGGLLVGTVTAKTISLATKTPFMAINHLEAHLLTARLCYDVAFPYLLLLASGGHFIIAEILGVANYKILGETLDDAAGECFDKVAKMLGLKYPGGPAIQNCAVNGDPRRFHYTIPLQKKCGCNVSFSGIKTATKLHIDSIKNITLQDKYDIAASLQNVVVTFITKQIERALEMTTSNPSNLVIAGGVAANLALRNRLLTFAERMGLHFWAPPVNLCADNAAMVAWCAIERIKAGFKHSDLRFPTRPRWPITEI